MSSSRIRHPPSSRYDNRYDTGVGLPNFAGTTSDDNQGRFSTTGPTLSKTSPGRSFPRVHKFLQGDQPRTRSDLWSFSGSPRVPTGCEKGCHFGAPTGPRMAPDLYSAAGTRDGPSVSGAHGGPMPTATAGAAGGRDQNL